MRPYIVRHLLGTAGAAAVVVVTLCAGWPLYDGVAQVDAATDDAILAVGQCIEANTSVGPLEVVLIKEGIIEENLLQTKVTNEMCKDMLERIPDGTPVRKLVAAQNYIQEIKLIEGAMRRAAGEAAARGTGGAGTGGVESRKRQAAAAASVGEEDNDASIAEMLRLKEAALKREGTSTSEARAGARCSTEIEVSDDEIKKSVLFEIIPQMPKEMRVRETEQAGLLISPVMKKRFEEIRQKHGKIDEESESGIGCVELVDRMKAQLVPLDLEGLGIYRYHPDDRRELSSNRDTRWGWAITARQPGHPALLLDLRYAIWREGQEEFRSVSQSPPVYEEAIRVTLRQSGSSQEATERPWWRHFFSIFEGILERIFGFFGA
jgi:hypothetical protein